jgi:hypothetical protein
MFTPPFAVFARKEKKEVFIRLLSKICGSVGAGDGG